MDNVAFHKTGEGHELVFLPPFPPGKRTFEDQLLCQGRTDETCGDVCQLVHPLWLLLAAMLAEGRHSVVGLLFSYTGTFVFVCCRLALIDHKCELSHPIGQVSLTFMVGAL